MSELARINEQLETERYTLELAENDLKRAKAERQQRPNEREVDDLVQRCKREVERIRERISDFEEYKAAQSSPTALERRQKTHALIIRQVADATKAAERRPTVVKEKIERGFALVREGLAELAALNAEALAAARMAAKAVLGERWASDGLLIQAAAAADSAGAADALVREIKRAGLGTVAIKSYQLFALDADLRGAGLQDVMSVEADRLKARLAELVDRHAQELNELKKLAKEKA